MQKLTKPQCIKYFITLSVYPCITLGFLNVLRVYKCHIDYYMVHNIILSCIFVIFISIIGQTSDINGHRLYHQLHFNCSRSGNAVLIFQHSGQTQFDTKM